MTTAGALIARLGLEPHPEGGHYRETFRDRPPSGGRGSLTTVLYLLKAGEVSRWHRATDAVEVWHFHDGDDLALSLSADGKRIERRVLGRAAELQAVVPAGCWQSAVPLGAWTLTGCAVAPAFEFASFELAPQGWAPG
ncbi:MAG: cupin domain-containing protein [Alphaproteobacteria bacterium]|nr:cupin domain-containing protein [Alphaproteobacteria bacterium]